MIVRIPVVCDHVAGLEVAHFVRSRADRLQVERRVLGAGADGVLEDVLGQDLAGQSDERIEPRGDRVLEGDLDGVWRGGFDTGDILVVAQRGSRGAWIAEVLEGKGDIAGGERLAIVPLDAGFQLPCDTGAIADDAAVFDAGDL